MGMDVRGERRGPFERIEGPTLLATGAHQRAARCAEGEMSVIGRLTLHEKEIVAVRIAESRPPCAHALLVPERFEHRGVEAHARR
jgi:hypothetical protein